VPFSNIDMSHITDVNLSSRSNTVPEKHTQYWGSESISGDGPECERGWAAHTAVGGDVSTADFLKIFTLTTKHVIKVMDRSLE